MGIKRIFDFIISSIGLVILFPAFIIIAILIKATSKGTVFFRQQRVGKNGILFYIYKFRTMKAAAGAEITIGRDSRITKLGHILRKFKIDELPQLINVLKGEMSLVGPRPEVPRYVKFYPQDIYNIVLSVRPGITDWASINMINENYILAQAADPEYEYINVIMPKKLEFAVKYVRTHNFWQDCLIIVTTIRKICKVDVA
ncbi:MAG: sugar transferase [Burkholderiales bacterium]|nr:sugar transferase [Burkholderiales bacterium]